VEGTPHGSLNIGGGWQFGMEMDWERRCRWAEGRWLPTCLLARAREFVQAAALVSQPALYSPKKFAGAPCCCSLPGPKWADLFEPGVKHALFVGTGIQILQQVIKKIILLCPTNHVSLHYASSNEEGNNWQMIRWLLIWVA
jgi:hypothetical protein